MSTTTLTIPPTQELLAVIRARSQELRALRRLFKLAQAAEQAREASEQREALGEVAPYAT
jgi:hypothetical protein